MNETNWTGLNDTRFETVQLSCNHSAFSQVDKRISANDDNVRCHCIGHLYCHCILETCLLNQSLDNRIQECNQLCNYQFLLCNSTIANITIEFCTNYPIDSHFLFFAGITICVLFILALFSLFGIVARDTLAGNSFIFKSKIKPNRSLRLTNEPAVSFNDKFMQNTLLFRKSLPILPMQRKTLSEICSKRNSLPNQSSFNGKSKRI